MSTQIAVVTGASGDVGKHLIQMLLTRNWIVFAQYNAHPGQPAENLHWWHADFSDPQHITAPQLPSDQLHALIHTAGIAPLGAVANTTPETWSKTMNVNLLGPIELTRQLLPDLREGAGQLIYFNSGAGKTAHAQWGAYAASKFAASAWMETLRQEEPSIRVSSIYPGRIDTEMQRQVVAQEGGVYTPERYLSAHTVAKAALDILDAPPDAAIPELVIRPNLQRTMRKVGDH